MHAAFGDRVAPRHGELIDATIGLPLEADDLIELRGVEIDRWHRRWCRRRRIEWSLAFCERRPDRGCHLRRIAMSADVHVEGGRICPQQMIVNSRDIEAAFEQLRHDRIDLGIEQNEIAHHHRFTVHGLEGDPPAER